MDASFYSWMASASSASAASGAMQIEERKVDSLQPDDEDAARQLSLTGNSSYHREAIMSTLGSSASASAPSASRKRSATAPAAVPGVLMPNPPTAFFALLTLWMEQASVRMGSAQASQQLKAYFGNLQYCSVHHEWVESKHLVVNAPASVLLDTCGVCISRTILEGGAPLSLYNTMRRLLPQQAGLIPMAIARERWEKTRAELDNAEQTTPKLVIQEAIEWMLYENTIWEHAAQLRQLFRTNRAELEQSRVLAEGSPMRDEFRLYKDRYHVRRDVKSAYLCDVHRELGDAVFTRELDKYNPQCGVCLAVDPGHEYERELQEDEKKRSAASGGEGKFFIGGGASASSASTESEREYEWI